MNVLRKFWESLTGAGRLRDQVRSLDSYNESLDTALRLMANDYYRFRPALKEVAINPCALVLRYTYMAGQSDPDPLLEGDSWPSSAC